ncbi:unnamed protein product [Staurois parvus]|uniref:Uncharacterized protein n=1 Tax=Staurois parvus TaxID=386267 RepID=A0ABN9AVS2_9NEOB|nr:unnamed protein product [Staurois parvus]
MSKNSTHQQCVRRPESGTWQSWRWRQQQWEAVQGPMTDSGLGSSMRRRYRGPWQRLGSWQQLWEARNLPAPYVKKIQHTSSVRRPESGTWHERLWTWQQHEEAVQGPMAD